MDVVVKIDHDLVPVKDAAALDVPIARRPAPLAPGLRLLTVTGGPLWDAAEEFLYEIYREVNFCEVSPRRRVEKLQPWAPRSVFHCVVDETDAVVGTLRVIPGTYADLPIGQFERTDFRHEDPLCELSSGAVRQEARSTGVIEHLYRAAWIDALRTNAKGVVALIDSWLYEAFTEYYLWPFVPIAEGRFYMGGDVVPVGMSLEGSAYEFVARDRPEFWQWITEAMTPQEMAAWNMPINITDTALESVPVDEPTP